MEQERICITNGSEKDKKPMVESRERCEKLKQLESNDTKHLILELKQEYVELERKNKRDQEEKQVGELSFVYEGKNREEENTGREDTNECMHRHANGANRDNREMS